MLCVRAIRESMGQTTLGSANTVSYRTRHYHIRPAKAPDVEKVAGKHIKPSTLFCSFQCRDQSHMLEALNKAELK